MGVSTGQDLIWLLLFSRGYKISENISRIDEMLYNQWRNLHPLPLGEKEVIVYDLTAVKVFGDSCPLAERGYNAANSTEKQIKLAILISKFDKQPISQQIYPGNFNDITTMEGLAPVSYTHLTLPTKRIV